MRTAEQILGDMHKIINPGEYGLGNVPYSYDDKAAWVRLGELHDELATVLGELRQAFIATSEHAQQGLNLLYRD